MPLPRCWVSLFMLRVLFWRRGSCDLGGNIASEEGGWNVRPGSRVQIPPPPPNPTQKKAPRLAGLCGVWWWGGTLRQTYVTQRLRTAANSCGTVRNPALVAVNPTSSAWLGSPAKCITQDASSIPTCGIEPASASTHPTSGQAVTNRSRNALRPWS